jgi:benzoate-CoA ligase
MLKVSGIFVAPAEIENCLLQHEAVLECAVIGAEAGDGLIKPKAFVVLREEIRTGSRSDRVPVEVQSPTSNVQSSRVDRGSSPTIREGVALEQDSLRNALAEELKEFVKSHLAVYKYPRWIEFVSSLPKNDRGKIDRKKLKQG